MTRASSSLSNLDSRRPSAGPGVAPPDTRRPIRVLYSFQFKLGGPRTCGSAWHQVNGLAAQGADVTVFPGVVTWPVPQPVRVRPTLAFGKLRVPFSYVGDMAPSVLHDWIVARRLEKLAGKIDIIHAWPVGALETLKVARRLGIPVVLERPAAHTRSVFEGMANECRRLGIETPRGHIYAYNARHLRREEEEYRLADCLACPSDFVVRTFLDAGIAPGKLGRHQYGFDAGAFHPDERPRDSGRGLTMLFAGNCDPIKGVHYALEAWLQSPASKDGTFLIAGDWMPEYADKLAAALKHPSVRVLGHRTDVAGLMRSSDMLVLPSIVEGFGIVILEAMASGCVPLASDACTEICRDMENGLTHRAGDAAALSRQITRLHEDRPLLARLRAAGLRTAPEFTWAAAGAKLFDLYRGVLAGKARAGSG